MSAPVYMIVEFADPDRLAGLAGQLLGYTALDRRCHVLFRLRGVVWLQEPETWPTPSKIVQTWLTEQEFPTLHAYWQSAVTAAEPRLQYCDSSVKTLAPSFVTDQNLHEGSLVRFMLEAEDAGVEVRWLS